MVQFAETGRCVCYHHGRVKERPFLVSEKEFNWGGDNDKQLLLYEAISIKHDLDSLFKH